MHTWVIEMFNLALGRWEPTAGSHPIREDARREINFDWRFNHPGVKFRIKKYIQA